MLLLLAALAACTPVDSDQARLCRIAVPAIEPAGSRIAILRAEGAPSGVRLDYRSEPPGEVAARHGVACRFSAANRTDLVGLVRDGAEVPGATIFLLKRYFIDTPDGIAADPGPPGRDTGLPELPPEVAIALQHLVSGLAGITAAGLLAAAYGLIYGLVGRINLAFGALASIGAAAAGLGFALLGQGHLLAGLAAALLVGVAAGAVHGGASGWATFWLVPSSRPQASLIATVGLAVALSEYLRLAGDAAPAWIPAGGGDPIPLARAGAFVVTATQTGLVTAALGAAASLGLLLAMRHSRFGRDWRAASDDARAAALCGVDVRGVILRSAALSGAVAGLAGALVAIRFGALGFADGFGLGLKALAGAVLGGIGSVPGALAGGLAIGLFEAAWPIAFPVEGRDLALYLLLVGAVVLVRRSPVDSL